MDRFKTLKTVVYLLTVIVLFETVMLAVMLFPGNMHLWVAIAALLVALLYLASLSLGLIKELRQIKKTDRKQ